MQFAKYFAHRLLNRNTLTKLRGSCAGYSKLSGLRMGSEKDTSSICLFDVDGTLTFPRQVNESDSFVFIINVSIQNKKKHYFSFRKLNQKWMIFSKSCDRSVVLG